MNILVCLLIKFNHIYGQTMLAVYLEVDLLGHRVCLHSTYQKLSRNFTKFLQQFTCLPAVYRGSCDSPFFLSLSTVKLLKFSHHNMHILETFSSFNLHFLIPYELDHGFICCLYLLNVLNFFEKPFSNNLYICLILINFILYFNELSILLNFHIY